MALYKGYSSFEAQRTKTININDIELVKLDLLNHIFTRFGERVMMPTFGSLIPEMVFEPLDADTIQTVEEELANVINFDPRVSLQNIRPIIDFDNGSAEFRVTLLFIEFDIVDNMDLNIIFEGS